MTRTRYLTVPLTALAVLALSACGQASDASKTVSPSSTAASSAPSTPSATATPASSTQAGASQTASKPFTCENIMSPQMKSDQDSMSQNQYGTASKLIGQNTQDAKTVRGRTHQFGGVDCQYGVERDGAYVLFGASKITADQAKEVQAELTKQKFAKSTQEGFTVYSADIPWTNGDGSMQMPIAFAFDSQNGTWFWSTNKKEYALQMLKTYRG